MSESDKKDVIDNSTEESISATESIEKIFTPIISADCCCEAIQPATFEYCQETLNLTVGDCAGIELQCEARFLNVGVLLKNVCRGRKVVIGVFVCEQEKHELKVKGFRSREIAVPSGDGCCNIRIDNFYFILPEKNFCSKRKVVIEVIAHYSSFDFCCPC